MNKKKSKIRKSIRNFYIFLAISIIIVCISLISSELNKGNKTIEENLLSYHNKFDGNYVVNIKKNDFIKDKTLPMEQVYITDLIDSIDMNLNYLYEATENAELKYSYSIVEVLEATYTKNSVKQKVWEEEFEIKPLVESTSTGKSIAINESINIDLEKYNNKIYKFEEKYSMGLDATLSIQLRVNVDSVVNETSFNNKYTSDIKIDLGEKTTQVYGDFDVLEKEYVKNSYTTTIVSAMLITIYVLIILLAIIWLLHLLLKTKTTNILKNEYKLELNKILKYCGDKIVKLSQPMDLTNKEVIEVKDFGEIIKLSEELYKPVLYWASTEKEESDFFVITNTIIYRFKLKIN